jgi:biotin carboxyl carrier protein
MKIRVRIEEQEFLVEISDLHARPVRAMVDGETYEIWPEETSSVQTPQVSVEKAVNTPALGASASNNSTTLLNEPSGARSADRSKAVVSPIPGVILSISVKPGETVVMGQELCVLEAMKMKNILHANRSGTIAWVLIAPQEHVHHGQVLMEYTD